MFEAQALSRSHGKLGPSCEQSVHGVGQANPSTEGKLGHWHSSTQPPIRTTHSWKRAAVLGVSERAVITELVCAAIAVLLALRQDLTRPK